MARHGCRNHRLLLLFCISLAWTCVAISVAFAQPSGDDVRTGSDPFPIDLRLELTWNSVQSRVWAGDIHVASSTKLTPEAGRLSQPGNLTPRMLLTGGLQLSPTCDSLRFSPSPSIDHLRDRSGQFVSPRTTRGGISFRATGQLGDQIVILLQRDDANESASPVTIAMQDLLSGKPIESKFNETATWTLRRIEGDGLRVSLVPIQRETVDLKADRKGATEETLLFWDDQEATISFQCDWLNQTESQSLELVCETAIFADSSRSVAPQRWPVSIELGRGTVVGATWQPPKGDGCYELHWKLQRKVTSHSVLGVPMPESITESITHPMSLLRGANHDHLIRDSKKTIVVLSRQPQRKAGFGDITPLTLVGRIEPLARSWSIHHYLPLREATRFVSKGSATPPLGKATVAGKQVAELTPGSFSIHDLPIAKVGVRHRVRVRLPNGQAMKLGLCILDKPSFGGKPAMVRDLTCLRTRQRSGDSPWVTADVDYYPQSSASQLLLINRDETLTACFESIEVSVFNDKESAKPIVSAVSSTAPKTRTALMQLDIDQWLTTYGDLLPPQHGNEVQHGNAFVAAIRLVEAIRHEGYGGAMLTVCENGRSLYPSAQMTADTSSSAGLPISGNGDPETLELLLRIFDRESLVLLPCLRPNFPLTSLEQAVAGGVATGRGIAVLTPWNGLSTELSLNEVESACGGIYNPTNELVGTGITELTNELLRFCSGHSCVRSIGVIADEGSSLALPQARLSLDSHTLDRFHSSLPANTIARSQVAAWANNEGAENFERWRQDRLCNLYHHLAAAATADDKDLLVVTTMEQLPKGLLNISSDVRLSVSTLYRRSQLEPLAARSRDEQTTIGVNSLTSQPKNSFRNSLPTTKPNDRADGLESTTALFITPVSLLAPAPGDIEMQLKCGLSRSPISTTPALDPESVSLLVTSLLGRGDRNCIAVSGFATSGDNETRRRSLARFQSLPLVTMDDVPSADEAMKYARLRRVVHAGATYLVATNQSRWPISINVSLANVTGLQALLPTDVSPKVLSDGTWTASLQPGELIAVRALNTSAKVEVWSAQVEGGETRTTEIGNMMRELAVLLAATTEPKQANLIENAGFESDRFPKSSNVKSVDTTTSKKSLSAPENVAGWLLAQHPDEAAGIDDEVAFEGTRSVRLSNRDGRPGGTWIVSRPIETPASGRIAINFMVRGEPSEEARKAKPILVRFAIEGGVAGSNLRRTMSIEVPRNGQWSSAPCRIEIDSLPRCGVESLRFAIDVMNEGTVWIDDVKSEDSFLTEAEKSELQSQMFLAIGGIAKSELSPAVKLLESHWVQQILGAATGPPRPTMKPSREALDRAGSKGDKAFTEPRQPGVAERLKGWLPRSIRF